MPNKNAGTVINIFEDAIHHIILK